MRIVVTGAEGFLGRHLRLRLHATTEHEVVAVSRDDWPHLPEILGSADAIIHVAGVNRGSPEEVQAGNVRLAQDLADAIRTAGREIRVVYAGTTQQGNGSPYGNGKQRAAEILEEAEGVGLIDVVLPNLFGEHGRPNYNSFVASFAHGVVFGEELSVQDREVELLHVQSAAQTLIDGLDGGEVRIRPHGTMTSVAHVLDVLREQWALYRTGELPPLHDRLQSDLFNTLRSVDVGGHTPIPLTLHADQRGALVEAVRAHMSEGQTFFSTTRPGVTRGQHFHLRKFERFVVLKGRARISLRRVLSDAVMDFDVDGDHPVAIDMPTGWAHNITNTGEQDLLTAFWTNELFDPNNPDTYPEDV
ncbi:NAD-dependent epimerase/dehydratase family protein [uncultured Brachybacterium sp.]|uniref:polysaccharide biosynthesis C-terminal domain-containing protein n=1 Tax=uncultured Brachybacterium sp. TaxID=189680 RepID=UPI0026294BAF|nr:NAD-dependent epimerase/dehydratase family protein [uncultured Brachybacterium sp.]